VTISYIVNILNFPDLISRNAVKFLAQKDCKMQCVFAHKVISFISNNFNLSVELYRNLIICMAVANSKDVLQLSTFVLLSTGY
jgi:hypothetical protein